MLHVLVGGGLHHLEYFRRLGAGSPGNWAEAGGRALCAGGGRGLSGWMLWLHDCGKQLVLVGSACWVKQELVEDRPAL